MGGEKIYKYFFKNNLFCVFFNLIFYFILYSSFILSFLFVNNTKIIIAFYEYMIFIPNLLFDIFDYNRNYMRFAINLIKIFKFIYPAIACTSRDFRQFKYHH